MNDLRSKFDAAVEVLFWAHFIRPSKAIASIALEEFSWNGKTIQGDEWHR